jgi:WD40 repeat protein
VYPVAFGPGGERIVCGSGDENVRVWDAASGRQVLSLIGHTDTVRSVAFSPDGKWIASGSSDGTVMVWDAREGEDNPHVQWPR